MIERLPCGCKHDGREWTFMCEPCKAEYDQRHAQAAEDHQQAEALKRFKELF